MDRYKWKNLSSLCLFLIFFSYLVFSYIFISVLSDYAFNMSLMCSHTNTHTHTHTHTFININIDISKDLTNKMKCSFFQAVVMSILLNGCTSWALTKHMEKKLDGNSTRKLWAISNKSWRPHPTKQQLYGHLPSITKTIKIRRTRHEGHCWRSRDELISDELLWTPSHG